MSEAVSVDGEGLAKDGAKADVVMQLKTNKELLEISNPCGTTQQ
jgi:hypothetical protein